MVRIMFWFCQLLELSTIVLLHKLKIKDRSLTISRLILNLIWYQNRTWNHVITTPFFILTTLKVLEQIRRSKTILRFNETWKHNFLAIKLPFFTYNIFNKTSRLPLSDLTYSVKDGFYLGMLEKQLWETH